MTERVLPHNIEAEKSVLGAILIHNEAFNRAAELIDSRDFFRDAHRRIFHRMAALSERNDPIDFVTLREELGRSGELEEVGGPAYVASLADGVPRSANVEHYARIVKDKAALRKVIHVAQRLAARAYDGEIDTMALQQAEGLVTATADPLPVFTTLRALLEQPDDPIEWSFGDLQPSVSRALLAAQYKAGKTTLVRNVVQSKADGDPLFGVFATTAGVIVVLDFEMSARQLKKWYRSGDIRRTDRVVLLSMRGRVGEFNILDRAIRRRWAERLRDSGATYLVIDCLRPILDALGLDEHKDAGRLLVAIDALIAEAGIPDLLLVHHMGHANERSRGDSRLRDWPDVEWQLVRKTEDAGSPRFFKAYGRDVSIDEGQLAWDAETRRLTLIGGSRKDAQLDKVLADVREVLAQQKRPMSGREIKKALTDTHTRQAVDDALGRGRESGSLGFEIGPRQAFLYRVSGVSGECPPDGASECPGAYISPDTRTLGSSGNGRTSGRTLATGGNDAAVY